MVPGDEESLQERENLCLANGFNMSDSFWGIMRYAVKENHRVVLLDCDAEVTEGLPVNDW